MRTNKQEAIWANWEAGYMERNNLKDPHAELLKEVLRTIDLERTQTRLDVSANIQRERFPIDPAEQAARLADFTWAPGKVRRVTVN